MAWTIQKRTTMSISGHPMQFEVVMQRRHPEDPLACELERPDLHDHRDRR